VSPEVRPADAALEESFLEKRRDALASTGGESGGSCSFPGVSPSLLANSRKRPFILFLARPAAVPVRALR